MATAAGQSSGGSSETGPDRNLAGKRLGRYEVLTQLASGGMAGVYAGRAVGVAGFERLVAIKVLHPHLAYEEEFISMFLDEARLAARIRHPNVVATLDISDSDGDGYFIVMEYIEGDHFGGLLGKAARGGERLPVPVVIRVVLDALGGLNAAHKLVDETGAPLELVHRDVSPHNVMVGKDGISRLTDFGVAKAQVRLSSTRAGQFKGKLSYMAPEQASTGVADQRSDLFSMAIILWEGLTGRRLFRAENNAATLNKILRETVPMPSELFPELTPFDEVLTRALARDPDDRYQTAEELLEAIEGASQSMGGVASTRRVAKEVERWDSEKLAAEAVRLRDAMDALGHTDLHEAQMPMPREGSVSRISGRQPSPSGPEEPAVAGSPGAVASARREQANQKKKLGLGLLLLGLAIAGLVVWLTSTGQPSAPAANAPVAQPAVTPETGATPAPPPEPEEANPPTAGETAAPPEDEAADLGAEVAPEDTAEAAGNERGRRRHRRGNRPLDTAATDSTAAAPAMPAATMTPATATPTTMTPTTMPPATITGAPTDELLANPYRR